MTKAVVVKGIGVRVPDAVGALEKVVTPLAEAQVNVDALWAGSIVGEGQIVVVVKDVSKAVDVLKNVNIVPWETDVVAVDVVNEPGAVASVVSKVTQSGVDVTSCWVTTAVDVPTRVYMVTKDNAKVVSVIG